MVVIERRWVVEQDFGDSILGYWARETRRRRRDFAGVEVWRRRASSCGGSDWCDRENGATSEVATGEKIGRAVAKASAKQRHCRSTLLVGREKELSLPESGLAREVSSWSELMGGATMERWRKNRKASGLAAGDPAR